MGIFNFLKSSNGNEKGDATPPHHEENWATYLTNIDDGSVGSIVVDLGLREVAPLAHLRELLINEVPI